MEFRVALWKLDAHSDAICHVHTLKPTPAKDSTIRERAQNNKQKTTTAEATIKMCHCLKCDQFHFSKREKAKEWITHRQYHWNISLSIDEFYTVLRLIFMYCGRWRQRRHVVFFFSVGVAISSIENMFYRLYFIVFAIRRPALITSFSMHYDSLIYASHHRAKPLQNEHENSYFMFCRHRRNSTTIATTTADKKNFCVVRI